MNERMRIGAAPEYTPGELPQILNQPFPQYVDRELVRRYQNVFCSALRVAGGSGERRSAAYIASDGKRPPTVILYQRERDRITVANAYFAIGADELAGMTRHLFDAHPEAKLIVLDAVAVEPGHLPFPHQRFNASEDIVIRLPSAPEAYCAALGRNTRAAIRRGERLLQARSAPVEFSFYDRGAVGRERIAQLVELSRLRIAGKNQVPTHTERSVADLQRMVHAYGMTLLAHSEGRLCGGVVCTHVGSHVYMHVVTHDREFDDLRLGLLCCYRSVGEAIRRGAAEYHLLSGKYDYKYRLLGEQRDFDRIVIYRSRRALVANLPVYVHTLARGRGRAVKQHLASWRKTWKS